MTKRKKNDLKLRLLAPQQLPPGSHCCLQVVGYLSVVCLTGVIFVIVTCVLPGCCLCSPKKNDIIIVNIITMISDLCEIVAVIDEVGGVHPVSRSLDVTLLVIEQRQFIQCLANFIRNGL